MTADVVEDFIKSIIRGLGETDPEMIEAVRKLKEAGYKLGVLTNNWRSQAAGRLIFREVELFDQVVESCVVGMRKPEEEAGGGSRGRKPGTAKSVAGVAKSRSRGQAGGKPGASRGRRLRGPARDGRHRRRG